jgi:hypothetical protein
LLEDGCLQLILFIEIFEVGDLVLFGCDPKSAELGGIGNGAVVDAEGGVHDFIEGTAVDVLPLFDFGDEDAVLLGGIIVFLLIGVEFLGEEFDIFLELEFVFEVRVVVLEERLFGMSDGCFLGLLEFCEEDVNAGLFSG